MNCMCREHYVQLNSYMNHCLIPELKELKESLVVLLRNVESWRVFDTQTLSSFLVYTHFQIAHIRYLDGIACHKPQRPPHRYQEE